MKLDPILPASAKNSTLSKFSLILGTPDSCVFAISSAVGTPSGFTRIWALTVLRTEYPQSPKCHPIQPILLGDGSILKLKSTQRGGFHDTNFMVDSFVLFFPFGVRYWPSNSTGPQRSIRTLQGIHQPTLRNSQKLQPRNKPDFNHLVCYQPQLRQYECFRIGFFWASDFRCLLSKPLRYNYLRSWRNAHRNSCLW